MLCDECALYERVCSEGDFGGAPFAAASPYTERLQVDYATGELDRLRIMGPIDTKLFIGKISLLVAELFCAAP